MRSAPPGVTTFTGQLGHEARDLEQVALAARVETLAVLAQQHVVDAVGIGERRAHAGVVADRTHAGKRVHLPAQPGDDRGGGRSRRAEQHAVRLAGRALGLVRDGRAVAPHRGGPLRRREDLERQPGAGQQLARGVDDLDPDALAR
jgi:hypothetical protein